METKQNLNQPKKTSKPRQPKYDSKVAFNGTFDDLLNISLTGAGAKKKEETKKK